MARIALVAAAATGAAALTAVAPSGANRTGGAAGPAANEPPVASLRAKQRRPRVGRKVLLDSSRSRDPDGRIAYRLWDLDGDGVYERNSGRRARIRHAFNRSGKVRVAVVVVDDRGAYDVRRARFRALPVARDERHTGRTGATKRHSARVRAATRSKKRRAAVSVTRARTAAPVTVHAAAASSSSVSIKDYKYVPKSLTVKVGDTVTWTNQDTVEHTATADDGTFDTGLMSKGTSRSYTFNKAGKFNYHCAPHDFMKASVTVTGSGGGSSPSSSSGNSNGGGSGSSKSSSLPHTGLQIASVVLAGLALLGAGWALRRRLSRP